MIATRGFEELERKTHFLTLVNSADQAIEALELLRNKDFDDGLQTRRWIESKGNTWQARAISMQIALQDRLTARDVALCNIRSDQEISDTHEQQNA